MLGYLCGFWYLKKELSSLQFLGNFIFMLFVSNIASKIAIALEYYLSGGTLTYSYIIHSSGRTGLSILAAYVFCELRSKSITINERFAILMSSIIGIFIIGKWQCFITRDSCHGYPTDLPWGVLYDGVAVHPTILYDIFFGTLLFVSLFFLEKKEKLSYFFLYNCGLFCLSLYSIFIEIFKHKKVFLDIISLNQICYGVLIVIVMISFVQNRRKLKQLENTKTSPH